MNKEEIEKIRETLDDYNDLIDYDYGHKDMDLLVDMITNITNVLEKLDKSNNKIEKIKEYLQNYKEPLYIPDDLLIFLELILGDD